MLWNPNRVAAADVRRRISRWARWLHFPRPAITFCKRALVLSLAMALTKATCIAQTQKIATQFSLDAAQIPAAVRQEAQTKPWTDNERGPVDGLKLFATEKSGAVWLGSEQGAARFDAKAKDHWDRWQYFYGRRWLQDNDVRSIW